MKETKVFSNTSTRGEDWCHKRDLESQEINISEVQQFKTEARMIDDQ